MFCPGTQPDWCGRQRGAGILWFELDTTNHLLHSRPLKQCDVFERSMLILLNIIINKQDQSVQFSVFRRMKMSPSQYFQLASVFFSRNNRLSCRLAPDILHYAARGCSAFKGGINCA